MWVATSCIGCGSRELDTLPGQYNPFVVHRFCGYDDLATPVPLYTASYSCRQCGLVFSGLRPDDREMAALYTDYRGPAYNRIRTRLEPGYEHIAAKVGSDPVEVANRNRMLLAFLREHLPLPVKWVLDYGGDRGQFIPEGVGTNKVVYEVSGAAPDPGVISHNNLEAVGRGYDLVLCQHVLEHVPKPKTVLADLRRVVAHAGCVVLVVPLARWNGFYSATSFPTYYNEHITFFHQDSLILCIESTRLWRVVNCVVREVEYGWCKGSVVMALALPTIHEPGPGVPGCEVGGRGMTGCAMPGVRSCLAARPGQGAPGVCPRVARRPGGGDTLGTGSMPGRVGGRVVGRGHALV